MQDSLDDDNQKLNRNILRQIQHLTDPNIKVKFVAQNLLEQGQHVKWLRASSNESLNKQIIREEHPYETPAVIENSDLLNIVNIDSDAAGCVDTQTESQPEIYGVKTASKSTPAANEYEIFASTVMRNSKATNSQDFSTSQAGVEPEAKEEPIQILDNNVQITVNNKLSLNKHIEKLTQKGKQLISNSIASSGTKLTREQTTPNVNELSSLPS